MAEPSRLQEDVLGLLHSVIMGVAGAAPVYSLSATAVVLIAGVGALAPASLAYGALIMFGITFAYAHLNRIDANAGAIYSWVSRIFNPTMGFLAGWALLVSSVLFMVSATLPAAGAALLLLRPDLAADQRAVALTAVGLLCLVTALIMRGIALAGRAQLVMTTIELTALTAIVGLGAVKYGSAATQPAWWASLDPGAFSAASFSQGLVIALFFFWGWDVALNLNEETRDRTRTPGLGALLAMLVITAAFVAFTVIALDALTDRELGRAGTNVVFIVAERLLPRPWSYVAVLALMLSTVGTLQTTMLQFSRTLFAQARDGALPMWLSRVHPRWRTPYASTALIAGLGALMLLGALLYPDVGSAMKASIDVVSVQAAFYYGLTGLACAWRFRAEPGWRSRLLRVAWPGASAVVMWGAGLLAMRGFGAVTNALAVGTLAAGLLPVAHYRRLRARVPRSVLAPRREDR